PLFLTDPSTTDIYTLSLHDALPISHGTGKNQFTRHHCSLRRRGAGLESPQGRNAAEKSARCAERWRRQLERNETRRCLAHGGARSEEHTSELQSRGHLVCRLLLEKK